MRTGQPLLLFLGLAGSAPASVDALRTAVPRSVAAPTPRSAARMVLAQPPPAQPDPFYSDGAELSQISSRISLRRLGDLQRLDANGDGVVSVSEAEVALFGPVTPLDTVIRLRTYTIVALVPIVAVAAYAALPDLVDSLSMTVIKRITPQSRELSRTLITSVLLPTNSLLFGTLVSTTISRLWERQRRLREELNTELQMLEDLTHSLRVLLRASPAKMTQSLQEVRGYLISLLCECSWRCSDEDRRTLGEDQRNHAWRMHELVFTAVDRAMVARCAMPEPLLLNTATATDNLITQLNVVRSRRRSSREGEFPAIHWALLTALGSSVLGAFLVECAGALDESFSEAVKVRVSFSFMCGFFTSLTALMADLSDPFTGEYRVDVVISNPVRVLKASLKEAVALRRAEAAERAAMPPKPSPISFEPRAVGLRERLRRLARAARRPPAPRAAARGGDPSRAAPTMTEMSSSSSQMSAGGPSGS